jgi:hypothetical protein
MPGLRRMQENGDVVLRFLAEDVAKDLDAILRVLSAIKVVDLPTI